MNLNHDSIKYRSGILNNNYFYNEVDDIVLFWQSNLKDLLWKKTPQFTVSL